MCFIPMQLRKPDAPARQANQSAPLQFTPASFAVHFVQELMFANCSSNRDRFDFRDRGDDREAHAVTLTHVRTFDGNLYQL